MKQHDINIAYRLTDLHFSATGADRQRVRLAAQLFSEQVSTALKTCFPDDQQALAMADFLLQMDMSFDVSCTL